MNLLWSEIAIVSGLSIGAVWFLYYILTWKSKRSLKGKVVLITGATSGLGEALAKVFYSAGCHVILVGRSMAKLTATKIALQQEPVKDGAPNLHTVLMELDYLQLIPDKAKEAIAFYDRIDILVNNAGISYRGRIEDTTVDVDQQLMLINYFAHVALTKEILPLMLKQGGGDIVAISSIQGKFSIPYRSAYSASKHAFQAFFDCLRSEVSDRNINVMVVSPGYVKTNLSINAVCGDGSNYGVLDKTTASGSPAERVAENVLSSLLHSDKDVVLATLVPKLAMYARVLAPNLFFKLMASRAKKQQNDFKKES